MSEFRVAVLFVSSCTALIMVLTCIVVWADLRVKERMDEIRRLLCQLPDKPNQSDAKAKDDSHVEHDVGRIS